MRAAMGMALLMMSMIAFGLISNESDLQIESRFSEPSYEPMSCSSSTAHDDDTNFYVDGTSGDDTYPGTSACPTKTIQQAVSNAGTNDVIIVGAGTYYETVALDSVGQRLKAASGDRVILDGSESVTGDLGGTWTVYDSTTHSDSIWKADLSKDAWQLFLSYQEEMPARWPNAQFSDFTALDDDDYWAHGTISGTDINNTDSDGDGFPDVGCPSGEELYQDGSDWYCVEYLNGVLEDDSSCCSSHSGLTASGINPVGSIAVLNIGSFRTWSREVLAYDSSAGSFTYDTVPASAWKYKHHAYFLTQNLTLLDAPGEWFFDDHSASNTVYYMPRNGADPNDLDIRMKTKAYGVTCDHKDDVIIEGIDFFSSAFNLDDCDGAQVRNSTLLYPSTSKRSLGVAGEDQDNRYVSRINDCVECLIDNCDFLYTDGAAFEAHGGASSSLRNQINNSYFYHIDWSGADQTSLMTTISMTGTANLFTNNTMHKTGTSATIRIGDAPKVFFNEIYDTAYLQSDGTVIQMMQGEQLNAEIAYNWVHDAPKYGIRMDGPFGGTNAGNNASVHHNVVWNINGGIIAKGDYHTVSYNTAFDSPASSSGRNDIVALFDDTGGNENSIVQYNAGDRMAGARTGSLSDNPFPTNSAISNNWNGYDSGNSGETVLAQLEDFSNKIFRPTSGSEMAAMGAGAYTASQTGSAPTSGANYDPSTYYWVPGIKRDSSSPYAQSTYTMPCFGGYYLSSGSCVAASAGNIVGTWGATSQAQCSYGTYASGTGNSICQSADAGHYVNAVGATGQTACPAGTFQPHTGKSWCTLAWGGQYTTGTGNSNQNNYCVAGEYSPTTGGATGCTPCPAGSFQPLTGRSYCTTAEGGQYVTGTGNTAQSACAAGSYSLTSGGASACTPCPAGTFQPSTGKSYCTTAWGGQYASGTGNTAQSPCAAGSYSPSSGGATSCTAVPADNYQDQAGMSWYTACPAGTSTGGSTGSDSSSDCS